MFKYFENTQMIQEARENGRGNGIVLEALKSILIAFGIVFGVSFMSLPTLYIAITQNASDSVLTIISLAINVFYIVAACLIANKSQKRKLSSIGVVNKNTLNEYVRGLIVGFLLFVGVIILGLIFGAFKFSGFDKTFNIGLWVAMFFGFMIQGAAEEFICRGLVMTSMARKNHVLSGIIVNSVIFGLLHFANEGFNLLAMINITAFGAFLSLYMLKEGSIWGVSAIHTVWNFAQGCIFGLPVSGTATTSIFKFETTGNVIINGGVFGPEAGIIVSIIVAIALVLFIVKFKPEPRNNTIVENTQKNIDSNADNNTISTERVVEKCLKKDKQASSNKSKKNSGKK